MVSSESYKTFCIYLVLSFFVLLITSCKKDNANNKEVLTISPEMLTSYLGENWNNISGGLKNKKDYLYTTINIDHTLAAIFLPAKDLQAPALNYRVLFNLNNVTNVAYCTCKSKKDVLS